MKKLAIVCLFFMLILATSACRPSQADISTQTVMVETSVAASWTVTPTLTPAPESTPDPTQTPIPAPTVSPTIITDAKGVEMVFVPAGEFTMGSENGGKDEIPIHQVYVDAFYMDRYEVTNALYAACVDAGVCALPTYAKYYNDAGYANHPVVYVGWDQAVSYCQWREARLPTEAEWEKAARGPDGRTYPWGEGLDCSKANYEGCNGGTSAVGSYADSASPYGAYDLAGNAWEWVSDWYDPSYYETLGGNVRNPQGPASGEFHVLRGGAWLYNEFGVRAANRDWLVVVGGYITDAIGFRCACSGQ